MNYNKHNNESIHNLLVALVVLLFASVTVRSDDEVEPQLRIVQHPRSQVAVRAARVSFRCEYEASASLQGETVHVKWLFDDSPSSASTTTPKLKPLTDIEQFEFDTNALHILAYDPARHTGLYRCLINSSTTALLSMPANLSLAQIHASERASDEVTKLDLSEGNVAHIECALPFSNPPAVPQFYLNQQAIPILAASRHRILPSGSLQISNARLADSGLYSCSALNPLTLAHVNVSATYLRVYNPATTMPPVIVQPPRETNRVLAGANLTLECVAQGAPVPLVTWEKFGGGQLPEGRASQLMGNLVIVDVREEDRGTYVCRAENGPGQATFKTALVEVFEAPTRVTAADGSEQQTVTRRGDRIDVRCPIRGRPRPDVVWFKDGSVIEAKTGGYRISNVGDKSVLTIESATSQLGGGKSAVYQCFARNEYGSSQADVFVNPSATSRPRQPVVPASSSSGHHLKHPQIILGPQNTTIYEGQTVVLLCVTNDQSTSSSGAGGVVSASASGAASGSATATGNTLINWLQNGLIIEPTLMRRFEINQLLGNLRIVSVQKSDAGLYKCIASNEFGMSTAEAYVTVKSASSSSSSSNRMNEEKSAQRKGSSNSQPLVKSAAATTTTTTSNTVQSSRPVVQQIGADKILLRWQLTDSRTGVNLDLDASAKATGSPAIAYFKVDYKTNSRQQQQQHQWLTIDEQIDAKKREYILTDLSLHEAYRFRITTFFVNGELSHSHQSARFRLDPAWTASQQAASAAASQTTELKLADIQVQISQIWAISSSSLGLKWDIFATTTGNRSAAELAKHINGFYIYYRKLDSPDMLAYESSPSLNTVPIYNYTRINIPISQVEQQQQQQQQNQQTANNMVVQQHALIDTYIIANLIASTQYEIKMTCYNLNGDLCAFSPPIYGLTLSESPLSAAGSSSTRVSSTTSSNHVNQAPSSSSSSSKQNEILFMVLGIVLGALTLLLALFVIMCVIRHRQHSKLLAQLHNTSHKLTSSSCPTLIYEDSLRQAAAAAHAASQHHIRHMLTQQQQQHQQQQLQSGGTYASSKLIDTSNLFVPLGGVGVGVGGNGPSSSSGNDSNSTNSQSMSTTTSSMTTPPALNSADHQQHVLMLNNNGNLIGSTTSGSSGSSSSGCNNKPPPIPQHPPPPIIGSHHHLHNQSTLNPRININLNPLNTYLDGHHMSPKQASGEHQSQPAAAASENFYHTLTTLGTLPNTDANPSAAQNDFSAAAVAAAAAAAADYTNTTLNMHRAHLLLKQQQQQQMIVMNTLKTLNMRSKQQQFYQQQQQQQQAAEHHNNPRSPSVGSMKRQSSVSSSKRSKKGNKSTSKQEMDNLDLQQQTNYYLLPNIRPNQASAINLNPILANRNIYNEMDLLTLEAALNPNNLTNLLLLNQQAGGGATSTFLPPQQQQQQAHSHHHHHLLMATSAHENVTPLIYGGNGAPTMNFFESAFMQQQQQQQAMSHMMSPTRNGMSSGEKANEYDESASRAGGAGGGAGEEEPMLATHYASSGISLKPVDDKQQHQQQQQSNADEENRKLI